MAWVVGKWAWVDGSGSKVLFAQMEWSWVLGISSKLSYIAVIPAVIAVKNTLKYQQIRLTEIRFLLGLDEFNCFISRKIARK